MERTNEKAIMVSKIKHPICKLDVCYVLWEQLKKEKLPKNIDVKVGKRSFALKIWNTKFRIDFYWWNVWYMFTNLSTNKTYRIKKWEEKILWKIWEILVDWDDIKASRKHLKVRVDEEGDLFLCDISTNGTIISGNDNIENLNSKKYILRKIKKEEVEHLHKYKNPEFVDSLLKTYWEPKYFAEVKWRKWLLTDKIIRSSGRTRVIWYVLVDWEYESRFFRRSRSEWDWRCAPEMEGSRISKWESIKNASYETTTKVDLDLRHALDDDLLKVNPKKWLPNPVIWSVLDTWKEEIKIRKMFPWLPNDATLFFKGKTIKQVKNLYKNLNMEWLDYKNMQYSPELDFSYGHNYLWKVCVKAYKMNYKWENLIFYFSYAINDPKKQVRIEHVIYEDSPINDSWIYTKQINIWPLSAKPIEYKDQIPKECLEEKWRNVYENDWAPIYYMDIRDLYQDNPIIKQYKKLEGLL